MLRKLISIAFVAMFMNGAAQAAVVADVQGAVQVNRGDGYQKAGNGTGVGPGDRVRTGDGSAAIVYENGCAVKVHPHRLVTVLPSPPRCVTGALAAESSLKDPPSGLPTEAVVLGGLVIGGGIALAVRSDPVSP
jgi:hypothetical protein